MYQQALNNVTQFDPEGSNCQFESHLLAEGDKPPSVNVTTVCPAPSEPITANNLYFRDQPESETDYHKPVTTVNNSSDVSPVTLYLARLAPGSHRKMKVGLIRALEAYSGFTLTSGPSAEEIFSFAWHRLRYGDILTIRGTLMKQYTAQQVNTALIAVRQVLKEAWRLGWMETEAYERAIDVSGVRQTTLPGGKLISKSQASAVFKSCQRDRLIDRRDAAILAVLYSSGIRRQELVQLNLCDFDPRESSLRIDGKGRKERTVYLADWADELLNGWIERRGRQAGPLFVTVCSLKAGQPELLQADSVYRMLKHRCQSAGLQPVSPHDLRRTFATQLLEAGCDVFTLSKLMGHTSIAMTARYDRRDETARKQAAFLVDIPLPPAAAAGGV